MTTPALPAPQPVTARRRVVFGLFNADGWIWASVKALFWFVVIIVMLGYIPDRAYYLTVQRTVDVGLLAWSPVNLCPPENETLPCPAPAGATLPWHPGPAEVSLPAPRTDGAAALIGQVFLFVGGSDGSVAKADTYVSHTTGTGNIGAWTAGPALPEARADAAYVVVGNTLYVMGGFDIDGKPTSTVFSLTLANDGTIGEWKVEDVLALPSPRAGASAVPVSDGIVLMGGTDGTAPTRSVWKSQQALTAGSPLEAWMDQQPLVEENMDGYAAHVGDVIFLVGGTNAQGEVVASVQQGLVGGPKTTTADPNAIVEPWAVSAQTNLPSPRTDESGFTANGVIYVQGGSDGTGLLTETLWATPDANGIIAEWHHLAQTDLGEGLEGASAVAWGSHAFLFGGTTASGPTNGVARTSLAPQEPFFQLGMLGATIPALKLDGEIGQQIGYLNAATVGGINFIILILIGYLYAHPDKVRAFMAKRRRKKD